MNDLAFNGTEEIAEEIVGLVLSENFDRVPAGALSQLTDVVQAGSTVTISTGVITALSGANCVTSGSNSGSAILSAKIDGSSGNCSVTGSIYYTGTLEASDIAGVTISVGGQYSYGQVGSNGYYLWANCFTNTSLTLARTNNAAYTGLVSNAGSPWAVGIWYTLTLTRNGNTFWASCQRQDTGQWLTSSGTWQTAYVAGINAYTDASPLSSASNYGGITLGSGPISNAYGDNLIVRDTTVPIPARPIKGMNCGNSQTVGFIVKDFWTDIGWGNYDGFKSQIDVAKSIGCNCIRIVGGYYATYAGWYTPAQYLANLSKVISYCKSQGMYYYLSEYTGETNAVINWAGPYFSVVDPNQQSDLFNAMAAGYAAVAQATVGYNNILGFDFIQEFNGGYGNVITMYNGGATWTAAGTFAMTSATILDLLNRSIAAIRAVAPNLPLTCSFNGISSSAGWTASDITTYSYLFDYLDQHIYYPTATPVGAADSQAMYTNKGTNKKSLFIGEFSYPYAAGTPRTGVVTSTWNNTVGATYSGQPGCFGGNWWDCTADLTNAPGGFSMWWNANPLSANAAPDVEPQYAAITAPTYSFGSNFRRRRR